MNDPPLEKWRDNIILCAKNHTRPPHRMKNVPVDPVLILAGSCRDESGPEWKQFITSLEQFLSNFKGCVISGGTVVGVCGEVGRLSITTPANTRSWKSTGYLPHSTPPDLLDNRYDELVFTDGANFSELEPLQYWTDILASGLIPSQVSFLRYGGGDLSEYEASLARELGACIIGDERN